MASRSGIWVMTVSNVCETSVFSRVSVISLYKRFWISGLWARENKVCEIVELYKLKKCFNKKTKTFYEQTLFFLYSNQNWGCGGKVGPFFAAAVADVVFI